MENINENNELKESKKLETCTLGGGCFWCLDAAYVKVRGVVSVESGYCNGHVAHPSYEQVCTGDTGHVEVVQLQFDAAQISLRDVLEIFFLLHDPTTRNRQGNDVGTQYRSGIYYTDVAQAQIANSLMTELAQSAAYKHAMVTEVLPLQNYHRAEDYHQNYFANNPFQGYCNAVIPPKLSKLKQTFSQFYLP